ncbi:MAG: sulfatase [Sandaracinaceae bacterium]|nr:sulfatase [Sandaracinaceae bacterium]
MFDSKRAPVARQIVVGFACAVLATALEVTIAALSEQPPPLSAAELAGASLDLLSLYAPLAVGLGALAGLCVLGLRRVRALQALARVSLSPRDLFRARPHSFSRLVGGAVALAAFAAGVTYGSHFFATEFHAPWLAAGANAAATVGLGLFIAFTLAVTRRARLAAAQALGPLASRGVFAVLVAIAAGVGVYAFSRAFPEFFYTYRPARVFGGPGLVLAYALGSLATAQLEGQRPERVRNVRRAASATLGLAVVGVLFGGLFYGRSNRTRHIVEDRTVAGRTVVQALIRLTDRDGDGFSFAYGGGDCDDGDPDIYPGAPDPPGDGVDSDCFAGDGGPAVAALGDGDYGDVPPEAPERPNILFLSVDALRPDHLGHQGYARDTSPAIDAFAETATRFDQAHAQSTRSIRSMTSLMTGLYPSEIRYGQELEWTGLDPSNETLAELLAQRGWQTGAVIGSTYFERAHGFFQGFRDVVQNEQPGRAAGVDRGLTMMSRMDAQDAPWFLWIHLMNVHQPYLPDGHASRYGTELMDQYDEEVALADEQVGRVLEALTARGHDDDTIVVLWSDHGEAFGEHGAFGHTTTLYEEELRAMTIVRAPGFTPRVVRQRVGLVDLFATVLNLVHQPAPRPIASRSLVPLMTGAEHDFGERALIGEIMPDGRFPFDRKCIIRGHDKLHWWVREGRVALFDLDADPGEEHDRSAEDPELAEELLGLLRAWTSSMSRPENQRRHAIRSELFDEPPARIQHRVDAGFQGAFTLLGCDVDATEVRPDGSLTVDCYYRVDEGTDRDYQFVLQAAVPADHPRLHHMESQHYPVGGRYMTSEWQAGEIIRDHVVLVLSPELQPGTTITPRLSIRDGRTALPFDSPHGTTVTLGDPIPVPGRTPPPFRAPIPSPAPLPVP